MHLRTVVATAFLAVGAVVSATMPARATATTPLAAWEMNEPAGASVMVDSVGGFNGSNGTLVATGVSSLADTAYRFSYFKPNTPPAQPQHNVTVPHTAALNPGTADYTVEIRYKTTKPFGNIAQKGQAGSVGGYWKIQLPQGEPSCLFRGGDGSTDSIRARGLKLNDGQWHTVRCERTATMVKLYVDGVYRGRNTGGSGTISNTQPLMVGGKNFCDQIVITCDYFAGDIDYLRIYN